MREIDFQTEGVECCDPARDRKRSLALLPFFKTLLGYVASEDYDVRCVDSSFVRSLSMSVRCAEDMEKLVQPTNIRVDDSEPLSFLFDFPEKVVLEQVTRRFENDLCSEMEVLTGDLSKARKIMYSRVSRMETTPDGDITVWVKAFGEEFFFTFEIVPKA